MDGEVYSRGEVGDSPFCAPKVVAKGVALALFTMDRQPVRCPDARWRTLAGNQPHHDGDGSMGLLNGAVGEGEEQQINETINDQTSIM